MIFPPSLKNLFSHKKEALSQALHLYKSAFDSTEVGYIVYSSETHEIIEINRAIYQLFELNGDEEFRKLMYTQ